MAPAACSRPNVFVYPNMQKYTTNLMHNEHWFGGDCAHNMYGIDVHLHRHLSRDSAKDPSAASLFFIPLYVACAVHSKGVDHHALMWEQLDLISRSQPWLNRSQGRDHFIALAYDTGACTLDAIDTRGRFKGIRRLVMTSDACFRRGYDVAIPPLLFNAWDPQPRPSFMDLQMNRQGAIGRPAKDPVIFLRANFDPNAGYPHKIRNLFRHRYLCKGDDVACPDPHVLMTEAWHTSHKVRYLDRLEHSRFCLHLPGHRYWTQRLFETMVYGCIPVSVVNTTDPLSNYEFPFLHSPFDAPVLSMTMHDAIRNLSTVFDTPPRTLHAIEKRVRAYAEMIYPLNVTLKNIVKQMTATACVGGSVP